MAIVSNAAGAAVLGRTVSPDTYAGQPLVAYGTDMGADARWDAVLAFAARFANPRTGATPPAIGCGSTSELAEVRAALLDLRRYLDPAGTRPPSVPVAGVDTRPPFCGPLLVIPLFIDVDRRQELWDWAATVARSTGGSPWGLGAMAVSSASPYGSPPIYPLSATGYPTQLTALARVWRAPPAPGAAAYTQLAALEASRPGVSRLVHPSVVGSILLARP